MANSWVEISDPLVLGRVLKRLRVQVGVDRAELGRRTGYSAAIITSYEVGRRIPNAKFVRQADEVLDAGGMLVDFIEDMERAQYPAFFQDAARLEKEAVALHMYDALVINGLLQTEEYARTVFTNWRPLLDVDTVEQRVAARLARQEIFERKSTPTISFVMEKPSELTWFKSGYSQGDGGQCLEAALPWHTTGYSSGDGGACVEVATCPTSIHVRDSKQNPAAAPTLSVPTTAWQAFLGLARG